MSDTFALVGNWSTTPLGQPTSFIAAITTAIQESFILAAKTDGQLTLSSDGSQAVSFGGVSDANIIILKALPGGGPVTAILTSAAGAAQEVPFDTYLIIMCEGTPYTALSLERTPSTLTTVAYFLAQSE